MSRQLSGSSALQAVVSAVLVIGVLLLLVVNGQQDEDEQASGGGTDGTPTGVQDVSGLQLSDGFEPIPADEFFEAVTGAQKEAGTWRVVSTAETGGQASAPSTQDVAVRPGGVDVRIAMQGSFGPVVALWLQDTFYVRGLTAKAKPWLKPDSEGKVGQLLSGMLSYSDPSEFLGALREPAGFHLVGIEDTDAGKAAHYRIEIDARTFMGSQEVNEDDTIRMDMWVDKQDRPVQVVTVSHVGKGDLRSTLIYSDYGQELDLEAPPARLTTTELPAGLTG